MRLVSLFLLGLLITLMGGCAGAGAGGGVAADYFRGSVQSPGTTFLPEGSGTLIMDPVGSPTWMATGDIGGIGFKIATGPDGDVIQIGWSVFFGDLTVTPHGDEIDLTFSIEGELLVSGTVSAAQFPSLGSSAPLPPQGEYVGEYVVAMAGGVRGVGTIEGSVGADGQFLAFATSGSAAISNGDGFGGTLHAGGTVTDGLYSTHGSLFIQNPPPSFSYDGERLILRFNSLTVEPVAAWIDLRRK